MGGPRGRQVRKTGDKGDRRRETGKMGVAEQ